MFNGEWRNWPRPTLPGMGGPTFLFPPSPSARPPSTLPLKAPIAPPASPHTQLYATLNLNAPSTLPGVSKAQLIEDVAAAMYASKICSYAQVRARVCACVCACVWIHV